MSVLFPAPSRANVRSASSEAQQKRAERVMQRERQRQLGNLLAVYQGTATAQQGREFLVSVLVECGVGERLPITSDVAELSRIAGRLDVGLAIVEALEHASPGATGVLMGEHRARITAKDRETEAAQTEGALNAGEDGAERA